MAYATSGNKGKALQMSVIAAAQMVGAGLGVRVGMGVASTAFKAGVAAAKSAPKVLRSASVAVGRAARDGYHAARIVSAARRTVGMGPGLGKELVVSRRAADWAGKLWTKNGRQISVGGRMSADRLRQYRAPKFKPKQGFSQANFERRTGTKGPWPNNYRVRVRV